MALGQLKNALVQLKNALGQLKNALGPLKNQTRTNTRLVKEYRGVDDEHHRYELRPHQ